MSINKVPSKNVKYMVIFIAVFAFCYLCVSEHYEKSKKDEFSYLFSFVTPIHIWTCFITDSKLLNKNDLDLHFFLEKTDSKGKKE